jgi:hypothetical protein
VSISVRVRPAGLPLAAALTAAALILAGCGSAAGPGSGSASPVRPPSLATSLSTGSGTWAVAVMGGSAATHNNFWQLFVRPAGSGSWRLATPPGVASNGGLVLAGLVTGPVVAGFRPSQNLAFSPLAFTRDNGTAWSAALLDAPLADVPDALAAVPGTGRLLALLADGQTEMSGPGGTGWARLAGQRQLAGSAGMARCGLRGLTAVSFGISGVPMVAGTCGRPGTVGIAAQTGGRWQLAGPALPAADTGARVTVLRLTTIAHATVALLAIGSGRAARLAVATLAAGHWSLSPPLPLNGSAPASASIGPAGTAVLLTPRRAETVTPGGGWRPLPLPPPGTTVLAPGATGGWDALAVHGARLTIWGLAPGARGWVAGQVVSVPIAYGSSG